MAIIPAVQGSRFAGYWNHQLRTNPFLLVLFIRIEKSPHLACHKSSQYELSVMSGGAQRSMVTLVRLIVKTIATRIWLGTAPSYQSSTIIIRLSFSGKIIQNMSFPRYPHDSNLMCYATSQTAGSRTHPGHTPYPVTG
jgi:hypothetical protein